LDLIWLLFGSGWVGFIPNICQRRQLIRYNNGQMRPILYTFQSHVVVMSIVRPWNKDPVLTNWPNWAAPIEKPGATHLPIARGASPTCPLCRLSTLHALRTNYKIPDPRQWWTTTLELSTIKSLNWIRILLNYLSEFKRIRTGDYRTYLTR
jgi:hypothetical protein